MNLYWAIYDGLSVYSVKLGNLIVHCSAEIEAFLKKLYHTLGGKPIYF